jgi:hypothetical protein
MQLKPEPRVAEAADENYIRNPDGTLKYIGPISTSPCYYGDDRERFPEAFQNHYNALIHDPDPVTRQSRETGQRLFIAIQKPERMYTFTAKQDDPFHQRGGDPWNQDGQQARARSAGSIFGGESSIFPNMPNSFFDLSRTSRPFEPQLQSSDNTASNHEDQRGKNSLEAGLKCAGELTTR